MQIWCMAHPWMTLFIVTLLIVVSGAVAISAVTVKYIGHKERRGESDEQIPKEAR